MARQRVPEGPPPAPTVQKVSVQYAKRGRLRFSSTRDFQRALERAVRRSGVPMAFSAGFHPHPRISYANAAPTGAASEAEYFQLQLTQACDVDALRRALDESLPPGLDIIKVADAGPGALADRLEVSRWQLDFEGLSLDTLTEAVGNFLQRTELLVTRMTKSGERKFDVRAAVTASDVTPIEGSQGDLVRWCLSIEHTTPAVRPNDVLKGLVEHTGVDISRPPLMTRLAQGRRGPRGTVLDPLSD